MCSTGLFTTCSKCRILVYLLSLLVQFAGGFDAETMQAFEELRDLALALNKK